MSPVNREKIHIWILRLSLLTAAIVALLSWISGILLSQVVLRAGVAFLVIYILVRGSFALFEKGAPVPETPALKASAQGTLLDIAVGDETISGNDTLSGDSAKSGGTSQGAKNLPGQIEPSLSSGLPDSERQAEIVRRMGWGEK